MMCFLAGLDVNYFSLLIKGPWGMKTISLLLNAVGISVQQFKKSTVKILIQ